MRGLATSGEGTAMTHKKGAASARKARSPDIENQADFFGVKVV
jgi:hypothetical protein